MYPGEVGFCFGVSARYVMSLLIKAVSRLRRKVQFLSISCELGSTSKYSQLNLSMPSLSLSQSADL